jgi:hypothetical protein
MSFYASETDRLMSKLASDAQREVDYRIREHIRAVPDTPGRDLVRQKQREIDELVRKTSQSNGNETLHRLADIVSADTRGSEPILVRILAVRAIGILNYTGKINLDPNSSEGERILWAIPTDPFPRGGIFLQGMLEASMEPEKPTIHPGRFHEVIEKIPSPNNLNEHDEWRRAAMVICAANFFRSNPDLSMILPEWEKVKGKDETGSSTDTEDKYMVPKYVLKLRAYLPGLQRGVGSRFNTQKGISHICSEEMQIVAAAFGMPRSNLYDAGDLLKRNPSIVRDFSRFALDEHDGESSERRQGLSLDSFYVLNDDKITELDDLYARTNGLINRQVIEHLHPGALEYISAVRVLRKLRRYAGHEREHVHGAIKNTIKRLKIPAEISELDEEGKLTGKKRKVPSILQSYVDQFNRDRGSLEGRNVSLKQAEESLRTTLVSLLCTFYPDSSTRRVRPERDLFEITNQLITKKGIPVEDVTRFSDLTRSSSFVTETIQRRRTLSGKKTSRNVDMLEDF